MRVRKSKGQFGDVYRKLKWYEGREDEIIMVVGAACVLFAVFFI